MGSLVVISEVSEPENEIVAMSKLKLRPETSGKSTFPANSQRPTDAHRVVIKTRRVGGSVVIAPIGRRTDSSWDYHSS